MEFLRELAVSGKKETLCTHCGHSYSPDCPVCEVSKNLKGLEDVCPNCGHKYSNRACEVCGSPGRIAMEFFIVK